MNRNTINLVATVLALVVFIGYLGESGPVEFFGFPVNIWVMRFIWLFMSLTFLSIYRKGKKAKLYLMIFTRTKP